MEINWPIAATILGGTAIFAFRPALSRLIDRLKSASKEGIQFIGTQGSTSNTPSLKFVELISMPLCPSAAAREKSIHAELDELKITDPSEQSKVLARALAAIRVDFEFETTYFSIFGSQLAFIRHLSAIPQGVPEHQATDFFNIAHSHFPDLHTDRTAEQWLTYLISRQLVSNNDSFISITQFGRDFLKYLIDQSLTLPKYG